MSDSEPSEDGTGGPAASGTAENGEGGVDYSAGEWQDPLSGAVPKEKLPAEIVEEVPYWESDPYLDHVSDRLMYNYTLSKDHREAGRQWDLYGEMRILNQKQFFHPALSYGDHESEEYLFARRTDRPTVQELERAIQLGHELADERVTGHEEHYRTDFTFVFVADEISHDAREFVSGFRDRNLLKYGYYGHYEVSVIVVDPRRQEAVASEAGDVVEAFTLWENVTEPTEGIVSRLAAQFWR